MTRAEVALSPEACPPRGRRGSRTIAAAVRSETVACAIPAAGRGPSRWRLDGCSAATFGIRLSPVAGYNLADGWSTVTINNDEAKPKSGSAAVSPTSSSALKTTSTFDLVVNGTSKKGSFTATITPNNGVFFSVTGGGNRTSLSVRITCANGYSTVITVPLDASGAGTTPVVYPGTGACMATLEDLMAIGRSRVLGSVAFTI